MLAVLASLASGCAPTSVDTSYGRSRGSSVNGTGAFAELLRQRGHEVRAAVRTSEPMAAWADVLVRFAPHPGLPDRDEGRWLFEWLQAKPGRKLVYVVRDFDAEPEFWEAMLQADPKPEAVERIKRRRDQSQLWVGTLPAKPKQVAREAEWFAIEPKPPAPSACKTLGGPWAEDVDAVAAAVSKHEVFKVEQDEPVWLSGDGSPLAVSWSFDNGSQVLALANGSFLLNGSLLNRARRPLTIRVAEWVGPASSHVAFVEGATPTADAEQAESSSPFRLLQIPPFDWISAHVLGFLLLLALSQAVRLGRPLPEPPSGIERPSAHPEALGALLAKTRRVDAAKALLDAYRRWRHPSQAAGRSPSAPPSSR